MKKMRRTRKHPFEFIASCCFMFPQSSRIQVAQSRSSHFEKTRISKRQTLSKVSLVDGNRICQNVKVCLQSTPNFVLFRLLEGLDHVLGYYIATHCWWATVSYAELRNKGHVWLAESNSKILVFYWLIQKAIRSAWNQEIGRVLFHWNLALCLYRDGETQRKSNMVVTIIWA